MLPKPSLTSGELTREDVQRHHVDLGVAVLASLRGGHFHYLARPVLGGRWKIRVNGCDFTLIMTNPPLRRAEHCIGNVSDAPESPWLKSWSSWSDIVVSI
jgi:hypothetical protein